MLSRLQERLRPKNRAKRLVIIDDLFPSLISGFRITEYNSYLQAFPTADVLTFGITTPWLGAPQTHEERHKEYRAAYPHFADRISKYAPAKLPADALAYTIFLNNIAKAVEDLDAKNIPFIFTLYPGGGFFLNDKESDEKLARVCRSPNLKKVIVTQNTSRKYLLEKRLLKDSQIEFIFGGTLDTDILQPQPRRKFPADKSTFDICFIAQKYMAGGKDKGYDVFLAVANALGEKHPEIRLHIVGPWTAADGDLGRIADRATFYGLQPTSFFPGFHSGMDLILAPTDVFVLKPGKFDGFPTGCCVEAALCGTVVFCTDPTNDNVKFEEGKDFIKITRDVDSIVRQIEEFLVNPSVLYSIGATGEQTFRKVYSRENQLAPRLKLLREQITAE